MLFFGCYPKNYTHCIVLVLPLLLGLVVNVWHHKTLPERGEVKRRSVGWTCWTLHLPTVHMFRGHGAVWFTGEHGYWGCLFWCSMINEREERAVCCWCGLPVDVGSGAHSQRSSGRTARDLLYLHNILPSFSEEFHTLTQGLSQDLETGCPKLATVKIWSINMLEIDILSNSSKYFGCPEGWFLRVQMTPRHPAG